MKRLIFLLLLLICASLCAQEITIENWQGYIELADSLSKEGKNDSAIAIMEYTYDLYRTKNIAEDSLLALFLHKLGTFYLKSKRYDVAETKSQKALQIRESLFGPDNCEVGHTLNNLGRN